VRSRLTGFLAILAGMTLCWVFSEAGELPSDGTPVIPDRPQLEFALSASLARVSNGGPDWSAVQGELLLLPGLQAGSPGALEPKAVSLSAQHAERFGQEDREIGAAATIGLGRVWTADIAARGSPAHRFLPIWAADVGASRILGSGWVAAGRLKHREYREAIVDGATLGLEKYIGVFRTQYEISSNGVRGAGAHVGHRLAADCFYGPDPRDRVRLSLAFGKEVEDVGTTGVVVSSVRDGSLFWQQRLHGRWGVESGVTLSDHGSLYTRREVQVGLRCAL
jgi:YaiO family outer membrane protein